jgi:post-segregation antitoxin (ccd killing protein)
MPGKRVSATLDPELHEEIRQLARVCGVSVSRVVRALLRAALDYEEDRYWAAEGERRLATFDRSKALTHDEVWQ